MSVGGGGGGMIGWMAVELLDASKWITCAVSLLLIIYGSYRSMKLDSVNLPDNKDSKKRNVRNTCGGNRSLLVTSLDRHKPSFTNHQNKFKSPTSPACDCFETSCRQQTLRHKTKRLSSAQNLDQNDGTLVSNSSRGVSERLVRTNNQHSDESELLDSKCVSNCRNNNASFPASSVEIANSTSGHASANCFGESCSFSSSGNSCSRSNQFSQSHRKNYCVKSATSKLGLEPDDRIRISNRHQTQSSPQQQQPTSYLVGGAGGVQVIDSGQALLLPVGASISLLFMFFFFHSFQILFALAIASVATVAFAFLIHPLCHLTLRPFVTLNRVSFGWVLGRHLPSEALSFVLSLSLVLAWLLTGHWLLMDLLSMGLCVSLIAHIRLPSLKVAVVLLVSLLVYDVFWVFCSSLLFHSNVMVAVATTPADNPVGFLAKKLNMGGVIPNGVQMAPKLSLPGKLVFPSHMAWEGEISNSQLLVSGENGGGGGSGTNAGGSQLYHNNPGQTIYLLPKNSRDELRHQHNHHAHHYHHNTDLIQASRRQEIIRGQLITNELQLHLDEQGANVHRFAGRGSNSNYAASDGDPGVDVARELFRDMHKSAARKRSKMKEDARGPDDNWEIPPSSMALISEQHMHYSMLGLGDVVMPGLLLCFVLRFDSLRSRSQNIFRASKCTSRSKGSNSTVSSVEGSGGASEASSERGCSSICNAITCFHTALFGYTIGLICATLTSEIFQHAQPALLYIVPATLLPLLVAAYLKGDLCDMWEGPFEVLSESGGESESFGGGRRGGATHHSRNASLDFLNSLISPALMDHDSNSCCLHSPSLHSSKGSPRKGNLSSPPFAKLSLQHNNHHGHRTNQNNTQPKDSFDSTLSSSEQKSQLGCKSVSSAVIIVDDDIFECLEPQLRDLRDQNEHDVDDDLFMPLYDSTELLTVQID